MKHAEISAKAPTARLVHAARAMSPSEATCFIEGIKWATLVNTVAWSIFVYLH